MEESPEIFVRNELADKGSYILNGNKSNEILTQIEYKDYKSPELKNLKLLNRGIVRIPRWLVNK